MIAEPNARGPLAGITSIRVKLGLLVVASTVEELVAGVDLLVRELERLLLPREELRPPRSSSSSRLRPPPLLPPRDPDDPPPWPANWPYSAETLESRTISVPTRLESTQKLWGEGPASSL